MAIRTLTSLNKSVGAQIDATNAAKQANVIAQQTLEITERAYISIEDPKVTHFRVGQTPRFSCILRNTGHRPATRIQLMAPFGYGPPWKGKGPRPISRGDFLMPASEDAGDVLGPGETQHFDLEIKNMIPPSMRKEIKKQMPNFQPLEIASVIAGQQELSITAVVAYMDGFGHARTSWKHLLYDPRFHGFGVDSSHES